MRDGYKREGEHYQEIAVLCYSLPNISYFHGFLTGFQKSKDKLKIQLLNEFFA